MKLLEINDLYSKRTGLRIYQMEIKRLFEKFFQDSLFYLELNIFQMDEILTF